MSYEHIAELYDAAFDWESDPGVILPIWERLGSPPHVTEVMCGPARLLRTLVEHGVEGVGIDESPAMLGLAKRYLADRLGNGATLIQAGVQNHTLPPTRGAFCAVGSFGHLGSEAAASHLALVREALQPGDGYAIQVGIAHVVDTEPREPNEFSTWTFDFDGEQLTYAWYGKGIVAARAEEVQCSRIEWLTGPRADEILHSDHLMHIWDLPSWTNLVQQAGFRHECALDPNADFAELPVDDGLYDYPVAWQILRAV